jgi:1-aminocyclopropane-1-carboxylate deaminase/D-cysteine desulfhydrase-like pyridoxal-dependent ACC family enzyme
MFHHLFDIKKKIRVQEIEKAFNTGQKYRFDVARFDEMDPIISGNKFFKLQYNIERVIKEEKNGIITMGGAYSNHLTATARLCALTGLNSIGLIRGEIPASLNHTLSYCQSQKMKLLAISRSSFDQPDKWIDDILNQYHDFLFVPMGGANPEGTRGAAEMADRIPEFEKYDIVMCCIGSGTMFNGLKQRITQHQTLIGVPVMKTDPTNDEHFLRSLIHENDPKNCRILTSFAGKGFGKAEPDIISLMNETYKEFDLPLDFVYTGKLLNALYALIIQGEIDPMKKIIFIHSGGLQGNLSLPPSTLVF